MRLYSSPVVEKIEVRAENNTHLKLNFVCAKSLGSIDYVNSYFKLIADYDDEQTGIFFHTFSNKISSSTGNYNVLTFYTTFVILIGNLIRDFFIKPAERIIYLDMPEPGSLLTLCEGIKISRYRYDFER